MTAPSPFAPVIALRDDPTVPASVRSTIGDWLARIEVGRRALVDLRVARDEAEQAVKDHARSAPDRVMAMLAVGQVIPDRIAPELEPARVAVRVADDRVRITRKAVDRCESAVLRCFAPFGAELVPWIAHQRVTAGRWGTVPAHVHHAWQVVHGSVRILLPTEAWQQHQGDTVTLVKPSTWPALSAELRHWWAWQQIEAGHYTVTTGNGSVPTWAITAPWTGTDSEPAPAGRTARGRR